MQFIWANSEGTLGLEDLLLKGAEKLLEKPRWHGGQKKEKKALSPADRILPIKVDNSSS